MSGTTLRYKIAMGIVASSVAKSRVPSIGCALAGALLTGSLPCVAANAEEAVPHHAVTIALDPADHSFEAIDHITLPVGTPARFRLGTHMRPSRIEVAGRPVQLKEQLGAWLLPTGAREVTVHYSARLSPPQDSGRHAGGEVAVVGPEGSFLPPWSGWIPEFDSQRVTYTVEVSVPRPHVAVATGRIDSETEVDGRYIARFTSEHAGEPPALFTGPYRIVESRDHGAPLRAYLHPEIPKGLGRSYLEQSAHVIARFSAEIGPYPFSAYTIVSAPLPVGLGFPGLTYIDRRILPLPFIRSQSLSHEILHNWWGNGVVPRYAEGNWAEGLTTYMADYGLADTARQRQMRLNWLRDYAALPAERDQPVSGFRSKQHDAAQVVGYNKVAFIFHMLRDEIGENAFARSIQTFWREHAHGHASWSDLRHVFEETAGRKLGWFFTQWVDRPGAPRIHLSEPYSEASAKGWRTTVHLRQDEPHYSVRVPLAIQTAAGIDHVHMDLAGAEGAATFLTAAKPDAVSVDPAHHLFRHLAPGEAPPSFRDVTLAGEAGVIIEADGDATEFAHQLAARLLDRPGRLINNAAAHTGPLLVVATEARLDHVLDQLGMTHWRAGPDRGHASGRAWVAMRDQDPVLIVAGKDAAALKALSRPLPHYGRESWIVFDGSKALNKGSWEVNDSPLRRSVNPHPAD